MEPQVAHDHYDFGKYTSPARWMSHYYQIRSIMRRNPESVLEIGVGNGILRSYLTGKTKVSYTSVDIAADLKPDIVASVTKLPLPDTSHDIACAFQVLEHLPFEEFSVAVNELCRVAKKAVIISLPHSSPSLSFLLKLPILPVLRWAYKLPIPVQHAFDGQHYWEIGKKGYPLSRIRSELRKIADIDEEFMPFENPYHRFFVLRPR
jgi:ubiquinone/menaquinone biosynthesis C-methylase UbiE